MKIRAKIPQYTLLSGDISIKPMPLSAITLTVKRKYPAKSLATKIKGMETSFPTAGINHIRAPSIPAANIPVTEKLSNRFERGAIRAEEPK